MSISFRCSNPECQQSVNAPLGTEGRKARCPTCGMVQMIPSASVELSLQEVDPPIIGVVCGDCGITLPPEAMLCSQCGWVNPDACGAPPVPPLPTAPPPAPSPTSGAETGSNSMAGDCLKAFTYGFSNLGSLSKMVFYSIGLAVFLELIRGFFNWLIVMGSIGYVALTALGILADIIVSGYFFRFYLDCAISSLEGVDQAPDVPAFEIKTLFMTGLKTMGVLFVYLLPVITIPLLPLALLAWAYSDDVRIFDISWALRAAAKKPGRLLSLWGVMLLWGVVGAVMIVSIWLLLVVLGGLLITSTESLFGRLLMFLILIVVGSFLLSVVFHTFMAVQFRCVGMLGRYNPDLTDMLPEKTTLILPIVVIIGGIVLSGVLWGAFLF